MKLIFVLILFPIFVLADNSFDYSPTYIPPNLNNPYNVKPNPYERELEELEKNIQEDLESNQKKKQKEGSENKWFYDIFKSLGDMFDSLF